MIIDNFNEFCDATALNTGGAASYLIGDVIDLGATSQDIGTGEDLYLVIQVDTAVDSAADNTVQQFHLVSDAQAAIAVDGDRLVDVDRSEAARIEDADHALLGGLGHHTGEGPARGGAAARVGVVTDPGDPGAGGLGGGGGSEGEQREGGEGGKEFHEALVVF